MRGTPNSRRLLRDRNCAVAMIRAVLFDFNRQDCKHGHLASLVAQRTGVIMSTVSSQVTSCAQG
jgi:hypothetical protein